MLKKFSFSGFREEPKNKTVSLRWICIWVLLRTMWRWGNDVTLLNLFTLYTVLNFFLNKCFDFKSIQLFFFK